jgi:hypothetical protein
VRGHRHSHAGPRADVSSLNWVETRMRLRVSKAPSQTRDRGKRVVVAVEPG